MKQLSDFIQVIEGAISEDDRLCVLDYLKKSNLWEAAAVIKDSGSIDRQWRNCDTINMSLLKSQHSELESVDQIVFSAVTKAMQKYQQSVGVGVSISIDTGYQALRYREGGFYRLHIDHSTEFHRNVSCSLAINDDFEGGKWSFFDGEVKIHVPAGAAVLFPSNFCFPHQILPVTKGTRYSIVTWLI